MELQDVELTAFIWPCEYYCMKRTGICATHDTFRKLPEHPVPKDTAAIPVGAILKWEVRKDNPDDRYMEETLTVKNGKVLTHWQLQDAHYRVYEGDGIVSDLCLFDSKAYIRMTELEKIHRPPVAMILPEDEPVQIPLGGRAGYSDKIIGRVYRDGSLPEVELCGLAPVRMSIPNPAYNPQCEDLRDSQPCLKPCPQCGKCSVSVKYDDRADRMTIQCASCGLVVMATDKDTTPEKLAEQWNKECANGKRSE